MKKIYLYLLTGLFASCEIRPIEVRPILGWNRIIISKNIQESDSMGVLVARYRQVCPVLYSDSIIDIGIYTSEAFVERGHTQVNLLFSYPTKTTIKKHDYYTFIAKFDTTACYEHILPDTAYERPAEEFHSVYILTGVGRSHMIWHSFHDTILPDTISFPICFSGTYDKYSGDPPASEPGRTMNTSHILGEISFVRE